MTNDRAAEREAFIIPARTLRGSRQEMLDDIDQAIVGLLALRHLIDDAAPPPEGLAAFGAHDRRRLSRWSRFLAAVLPAGFGGRTGRAGPGTQPRHPDRVFTAGSF